MRIALAGLLILLIVGACLVLADRSEAPAPLVFELEVEATEPQLVRTELLDSAKRSSSEDLARVPAGVPDGRESRANAGTGEPRAGRRPKRRTKRPRQACIVRVSRGAQGAPAQGIEVSLYSESRGAELEKLRTLGGLWPTAKGKGAVGYLAAGATNRKGVVQLITREPGPWLVYASDGLHGVVRAVEGSELDLRFPGRGEVEVHMIGKADSKLLDRHRLCLVPTFADLEGPIEPLACVATASGQLSYQARSGCWKRSAGEGHYEVWLRRQKGSTHCLVGEPLGVAVVVEGQTTRVDCDLGFLQPGSIEVLVTGPGGPLRGVEVRALVAEVAHASKRSLTAKTNRQGIARIGGVAPGTWRLLAQLRGGRGAASSPEIMVQPGGSTKASLLIDPAPSELLVVDVRSRQPLASTSVDVRVGKTLWWRRRTDKRGRLRLQVSPGSIELRRVPPRGLGQAQDQLEPEAQAVQWTKSGPVPAELGL